MEYFLNSLKLSKLVLHFEIKMFFLIVFKFWTFLIFSWFKNVFKAVYLPFALCVAHCLKSSMLVALVVFHLGLIVHVVQLDGGACCVPFGIYCSCGSAWWWRLLCSIWGLLFMWFSLMMALVVFHLGFIVHVVQHDDGACCVPFGIYCSCGLAIRARHFFYTKLTLIIHYTAV